MTKEIKNAAIKILVRREYAVSELKKKLEKKFDDSEADIDRVIQELDKDNLQSDTRYAEMVIRAGISKYRGPIRIKGELRLKGIDDETIIKAFAEEGTDWSKLILALEKKKYGASPEPKEPKDVAKRLRFYHGQGYSSEYIDLVMKDSWFTSGSVTTSQENEDIDE